MRIRVTKHYDLKNRYHFYDLKKKKKKKKANEWKAHALSVLRGKHVTSILRYLRDGLKKYLKKKKKTTRTSNLEFYFYRKIFIKDIYLFKEN